MAKQSVVVTGIGLVSSLGEGVESHLRQLAGASAPQPIIEAGAYAPALVHPLPAIDLSLIHI